MVKTLDLVVSRHTIRFTIGQCATDHFPMIDNAQPRDLWFHLEEYPSCHIIASVPEQVSRDVLRTIIQHGIRLSKEHSRYGNRVGVCYHRIRNIEKTLEEGRVRISL